MDLKSEKRTMTPDWLHQLLWFLAGIFATGAVWYFLSVKDFLNALWAGFIAVVVCLLCVVLLVRNDIIRRENTRETRVAKPTKVDPFTARFHTAMLFAYPGSLVYLYASKHGQLVAPIGYALVIEIVNNRSTAAKISEYHLDAGISGHWIRLHNISLLNPLDVFWVNNSNLKTSTRLDFRENGFDPQARSKNLSPGESLKGWMFFEWPPELRDKVPQFNKIRLQVENVQGDQQSFILDTIVPQEIGTSSLGGGEWKVLPKSEQADLSGLRIMPFMDLLKGFKDGKIK